MFKIKTKFLFLIFNRFLLKISLDFIINIIKQTTLLPNLMLLIMLIMNLKTLSKIIKGLANFFR